MRHINGVIGSAILAGAGLLPQPAWALWDDRLELFASEIVTRDSNVFRLSDRIDPVPIVGGTSLADTVFLTSLGFNLNVPVSLQRYELSYVYTDARYRRFEDLDHTGHNGRAAWFWSITPRLTGDVGVSAQRALASFANIQDRRPDLVTARMLFASGAWLATPSWRVHSAFQAGRIEHSDVRAINDLESANLEVGVSYVTAQENRIGVAVRAEEGRSPRETLLFGVPFDNGYRQESIGVQGRWVVTGLSRFDGRADYTRRRYDQVTSRNFSGPTFRLTYTYQPTGKITVATTAQRDIGALDDITTSFVLVTSATIRPEWAISDKLNLRGNLSYAKWDYKGDPLLGQEFEHRVKNYGLTLRYQAARNIAVSGGVAREVRTSTLTAGDYKVDTVSVEGRVGF